MRRIALAIALVAPLLAAGAASATGVTSDVTVTNRNTVSGEGNYGTSTVNNVGNGNIFYKGKGPVTKKVTVDQTNDVAGYYNEGHASTTNVGNGDITVKPGHKKVEYKAPEHKAPDFKAPGRRY